MRRGSRAPSSAYGRFQPIPAYNPGMERLHVFHNLPSGGGARVLSETLPLLADRFDLHVHAPAGSARVCTGETGMLQEWPFPEGARIGGATRLLGPIPYIRRLRAFESLCTRIAGAIDSSGPSCTLVHNSMFVAAPPLLRHLSTPSVYFCYEFPRHIYERDVIRRAGHRILEAALKPLERLEASLDREAVLSAGRIVTLSSYMAGRLRDIYGVDAKVVRPGVDGTFFHPAENSSDGGYALSVGALWPYKGHSLALRAAAAAGLREFVIVADREYPGFRRSLERAAGESGIRLLILRGIDYRELRALYRSAAVVLCCQRMEPYGLVPLEAMACGRPVVAVREGGFPENVSDGATGLLVDRNVDSVAGAISGIVGDVRMSRSLGACGRDFVISSRTVSSAVDALAREIGIVCAG